MRYIRSAVPLKGYRLFLNMESGSTVTVDLSVKLDSLRFGALRDEAFFETAATDGDYVLWGGGRMKLSARELLDVALIGEA